MTYGLTGWAEFAVWIAPLVLILMFWAFVVWRTTQ
jgi:hypothetical protein